MHYYKFIIPFDDEDDFGKFPIKYIFFISYIFIQTY